MQKGKINSNTLILVAALLFVAVSANWIKLGPLSAGIATGATPTISSSQSAVTGFCPSTGYTDVKIAAKYIQKSNNNQDVLVATTANMYLEGASSVTSSTTTSTSGAVYITGKVPCDVTQKFHLIVGDDTTYYKEDTGLVASGGTLKDVGTITLKKIGSAALSYHNDTATSWESASTVDMGVGDSKLVGIRVRQGTTDSYFGNTAYTVCAEYKTADLKEPVITSDAGLSLTKFSPTSGKFTVSSGNAIVCFEVPKALGPNDEDKYTMNLQSASSANPSTTMQVMVADKAGWVKNGVLSQVYNDQDTPSTDVGATDVGDGTTAFTVS